MNASPSDVAHFSTSREFALDCDAADILAPYRKQFELPASSNGQPLNYLCGHSLGLAPRAALDYVSEELADWAALFWKEGDAGRLVEHGAVQHLFESPKEELTAACVRGRRG